MVFLFSADKDLNAEYLEHLDTQNEALQEQLDLLHSMGWRETVIKCSS